MKQNQAQSFQNYQKMVTQSKQLKIKAKTDKTKKEIDQSRSNLHQNKKHLNLNQSKGHLNDQNDSKLVKNKSSVIMIKNKSIQRGQKIKKQTPQKNSSPNRHRNCTHSPVNNVSYGQLEVILKNIDSIKEKAKQQIEDLETKNKFLMNDIEYMKRKYQNVQHLQEQIQRQRTSMKSSQQTFRNEFQSQIHQVTLRQRIWRQQKEQYIQEIINFKQILRLNNLKVQQLQHNTYTENTQKRQWHSKFQALVNTITANKPERLQQLVYQIKQNYSEQSILDILSSFQKKIIVLENEKERMQIQIQNLTEYLSTERQRNFKNQQIIDKLMSQNKCLLQAISQKQIQFQQEKQALILLLENQKNLNSSTKTQFKTLQRQLNEKIQEISTLNKQITSLLQTIQSLKVDAQNVADEIQTEKFNNRYLQIVEEQCEQLEDISKVLKKMEMFQKCKIQNRTNIEKIQFLCKMLDC